MAGTEMPDTAGVGVPLDPGGMVRCESGVAWTAQLVSHDRQLDCRDAQKRKRSQ